MLASLGSATFIQLLDFYSSRGCFTEAGDALATHSAVV